MNLVCTGFSSLRHTEFLLRLALGCISQQKKFFSQYISHHQIQRPGNFDEVTGFNHKGLTKACFKS